MLNCTTHVSSTSHLEVFMEVCLEDCSDGVHYHITRFLQNVRNQLPSDRLTLHVACIVTNYINKPTRCTFCMYLFYNFCTTLHVSKDHFIHHQEFMIYCICSSVQTMQMCLTTRSYGLNWFGLLTVPTVRLSS